MAKQVSIARIDDYIGRAVIICIAGIMVNVISEELRESSDHKLRTFDTAKSQCSA